MYGDIKCPHCGYERKGTWDDGEGAPFEEMEYQCDECAEWFLVSCEAEVHFDFYSWEE